MDKEFIEMFRDYKTGPRPMRGNKGLLWFLNTMTGRRHRTGRGLSAMTDLHGSRPALQNSPEPRACFPRDNPHALEDGSLQPSLPQFTETTPLPGPGF